MNPISRATTTHQEAPAATVAAQGSYFFCNDFPIPICSITDLVIFNALEIKSKAEALVSK